MSDIKTNGQVAYKKGNILIRVKTAAQYQDVKNTENVPVKLREGHVFQCTEDSPESVNLVRGGAEIYIKDNVRMVTFAEFNMMQGLNATTSTTTTV